MLNGLTHVNTIYLSLHQMTACPWIVSDPLKESLSSKPQAKGLEFDTVELCGDFHEPYDENGVLISAERLRKPYLQEIPERCWGTKTYSN